MAAFDAPALTAIAFQLAAALDAYEQDVSALVATSFDPERYRRVSRHMDAMRMYAAALPSLSVPWVELMIRHFELTHALWRAQKDPAAAGELDPLLEQVRSAAQALSLRCTRLMPTA
jgi:hypothetical protein